jgi:type IV secretory pathway TrbF-like protein
MSASQKTSDSAKIRAGEVAENPYLQARGTWIERYGSYVAQAYNWRLVAVLESIALITAIIGLVYLAGQSKYVPYIVDVDKVGLALGVQPAQASSAMDQRVVHAEIANFLIRARGVITDRLAEKANIELVYAMIPDQQAARGFLDSWYPTHSPFERMRQETVQVHINDILLLTNSSYTAQWEEITRDLRGRQISSEIWEATLGIAFNPPKDEATILVNPVGLYITSITWAKKL